MSVSKMNLQPFLEDQLICLRPLKTSDFAPLYEVAKDPLIWEQHQIKNRHQKGVYRRFFNNSNNSGGAMVAIEKSSNSIIGSSRYKKIDHIDYAVEIGWTFLARKFWGGRYNFSMKSLMIDHALKNVSSIVFYIDINNIRSQRAVEKIGGKRMVGNQRNELLKNSPTDLTYLIDLDTWNKTKSCNS